MDNQSTLGVVAHLRTSPESCPYAAGRFEVSEKGLYYIYIPSKEDAKEAKQWIASPLKVVAKTRDEHGNEWGRLLRWQDDDSLLHEWAVPMEMLEGDPAEVRRILACQGLHIAAGPRRDLLLAYIKVWPVDQRVRCVSRLGWHGLVFVTPHGSIGATDEQYVYQNPHALDARTLPQGTLEGWQAGVARLAQGNSRLVFSICAALSGPLYELAQEGSGGFHLRGVSSSGKSTALGVAATVWGDPQTDIKSWRTTINGLEGLASLHSDRVLILDELNQADPCAVGEAAYLLGNGQGKTRATKHGTARPTQQWRLPFLSAGEVSLTELSAQVGKRATAGQEVRFADIEADAGAGLGVFETLHDSASPAEFAQALKAAVTQGHGVVGWAWVGELTKHHASLKEQVPWEVTAMAQHLAPIGATGQVERVARRFALAAVAGELATKFELTGWLQGEATRGVKACFDSWLENFGGTELREEQKILAYVRGVFAAHGGSRFENMKALHEQRIPNRIGFYRDTEDRAREYLLLAEMFRQELCKGFDEKLVKKTLLKAGMLLPGNDDRDTQVLRLPGYKSAQRGYVIRPE